MKKVAVSPGLVSILRLFLIFCVILALLPPSAVTVLAREGNASFGTVRGNDRIAASPGDAEPREADPDGDAVPPGCPGTITVNGGDYVGSCRVNPNASVILEKGTGWHPGQFGLVLRVVASTASPYEVYALSSSTWYPVISYGAPFNADTGSADDLLTAGGTFILGSDIFAGDEHTAIRLDFGNDFPSQSTVIYGGVNTIDDPADSYDDTWADLEPGESRMAFVHRNAGDYEYCNKSEYAPDDPSTRFTFLYTDYVDLGIDHDPPVVPSDNSSVTDLASLWSQSETANDGDWRCWSDRVPDDKLGALIEIANMAPAGNLDHKVEKAGPLRPMSLAASYDTYTDRIALSWSASAGATGYDIYRMPTAGLWSYLTSVLTDSYDDTGATPGIEYVYRVVACDGDSFCSYYSNEAVGRRAVPDDIDPTVAVTSPDGGESWEAGTTHDITWTATDNVLVTHVALDYSVNGGADWTSIASSETNDGTYPWLVPNDPTAAAQVRVTAYDAAGNEGSDTSDADFIITPPTDITDPTVAVTSPDGGESWEAGTTHDITWTATDNVLVTHVALDYSVNGGADWTSIASSETNDGTYAWLVPNDPSSAALVRVTAYDAAGNEGSDTSDADFIITPPTDITDPTVAVTSPDGGESWEAGTSHDITWTATDNVLVTHVALDYSVNGGADWTSIASSETNDGTYAWLVPNDPSTAALVRVTAYDAAGNEGSDTSDAEFFITPPTDITDPTVAVTSPNGGESWEAGTSHDITWTATDNVLVTHVALDYSVNGGADWTSIASSETNDGTYAWLVPNDPSTTALVRVTAYDAAGNEGDDSSDAVFTITPPATGDPYEPDNTWDLASVISNGVPQTHSIVPVGDVDWVKFTLAAESEVVLETSGAGGDTQLWLYDSGLNQIDFDDDGGTDLFSYIDRLCGVDALPAGTYYVKIDDYGNSNEIPSYELAYTVVQACADDVGPLEYDSHLVDDDTYNESFGDGDGIVECGERIELYVDLINQGTEAATSVNAVISTSDPYVTWLHNTGSLYPDLAAGGTGTNTDDFDLELHADTPDGHIIQFDLDVTASAGGPWTDSFSVPVSCNNPPDAPSDPTPADGATGVSISIDLSWTGGDPDAGDSVTYDVFFGTVDPPATLICDDIASPTCDPGTLSYNTHQYWKVVATDSHGASTSGPVWDFTTVTGGDAYEPDGTWDLANPITDGVPQTHSIVPVGDVDWVKFTLAAESEVVLETSGAGGDTQLWLYDSSLNQIDFDDDGGTDLFSRIDRVCDVDALPAGTYYVKIDEYGNNQEIPSYELAYTVVQACPGDVGPLEYDSHLVDDDTYNESFGDGDGIVECGESIELWVDLINLGADPATGVNAVISTSDPYVTWLHNTGSLYPDLAGGGTGTNTDDFDFSVDADVPDGHIIQFDLDITASERGPWTDSFSVPVSCNHAPYTPGDPSPPDGALDQDFDVDLSWTGGDPDGDLVTYDVYLGTTQPPADPVCSGISATTCDPGTLDESQEHFWSVVAADGELEATGPIWRFTTMSVPPTGPTSVTETHGVADDTWQGTVGDPAFIWSGAVDVGSGVAGYYVYWGTDPAGTSASWQDTTSYDPPAVPDPSVYYLRVQTGDQAGNTSAWLTLFTFRYDASPPTGPTSVTESSGVADNTWQGTVDDPAFTWSGAEDAGSGVAGYYVYWGADPGGTSTAWQTSTTYDPAAVSSPSVYYLRVQTEDNVGNTNAWQTLFTFRYDASSPTGPTSVIETHGVADDTWQGAVGDPAFTWSGASDEGSGVAGYYVYWGADPAGTASVWQSATAYDPPTVPSPSVYYLRVQTEDQAGNTSAWLTLFTFRYDASPPTGPTSVIETHGVADDTWQGTVDDPAFTWSGAGDADSGVAGYYVYWGPEPSGTSSVWQVAADYDPPAVSDPSVHYLRVQTEDNAGNRSAWLTLFTFRYDASPPTGPTSVTETHGVSDDAWQATVDDPAFTWSGAKDVGSGVAGYYVYWGADPGGASGAWQTAEAYDPPAVSNPSVYYLRVQTEDNAGNTSAWQTLFTFRYDASAPTNPTAFSSSHTLSTWSDDNTVYISWSGASDGTGSGVYGYSFAWSTSDATLPDAVVDTTGSDTTSPALSDSDNVYFHIRTRDNAGNWNSAAAHYGPFKIDTKAPVGPTSATETHGALDDTWQGAVGDPAFTWTGAEDAGSGVAGYYVYWGIDPDGTSTDWQGSAAYDPAAVPDPSVYYLRVQTGDEAGNTGDWVTLFTFRYDGTAPSNPTGFSSSHVLDVWSADNTIYISWSGATDGTGSGVYGYSFEWSTSSATLPDDVTDTTGSYTTSPALADDDNVYFHIRTRDKAGNWSSTAAHYGPFKIDTLAPSGPTSASETHGIADDVWQSALDDPAFLWSGAGDSGSGVAGYHVYWGADPDGVSTDWQDTTSFDPSAVPNPSAYYLRVQTVDHAGNTSAWKTLFTFRYDAAAPTNPVLSSSSHEPGAWSNLNVIDVSWSGASDGAGSGVYAYSYVWSSSPDTLPDTSVDTTGTSASSPPLPDSDGWYFHLRTVDNVSNWASEAVHLGPFRLEDIVPTSSVSALPGTQTTIAFTVSWTGTDLGIASGIAAYDVQYRVGSGGVWTDWLVGTTATSATFGPVNPAQLEDGATYYFRCRAIDHAGNQEDYPGGDGDAWTTVHFYSTFLPLVQR